MKMDVYQCDDCGTHFGVEQIEDDEIEEPICSACGSVFFEHVTEIEASIDANDD